MEQTTTTYLGSHVYFQISHFHYLIIISVFIFAVISLVDSLSTLTVFRKDEVKLLSTIGWDNRKIVSIWSREVAIWSCIAIVFGHLIGVVLFSLVFSFTLNHVFISFVSGVSFFIFTIIFSILYLRVLMNNRVNRKVKYAKSE
ncbi:ABC transporter permease family protein [Bacillus alkalisoli]|uniref:FtsX-like permease family protein n=1 Tax=Bacillus alkalisoli TaxID=2011008 RepID=UPI000C2373C9|nr:FtsX-like permease family protein [Bacillus alkalisoli]